MLRPDVRGVAPVPDDYGWRAKMISPHDNVNISRVTDYPGGDSTCLPAR